MADTYLGYKESVEFPHVCSIASDFVDPAPKHAECFLHIQKDSGGDKI